MSTLLPTKNNLIKLKKTIALSKQGQELLEKKKYILENEKQKYILQKKKLEETFHEQYEKAFIALQNTNVDMGINKVNTISHTIEIDNQLDVKYKTIMGIEIPLISYTNSSNPHLTFGLLGTTLSIDEAIVEFQNIKKIMIDLARLEITISRLDSAIEKVQKRSNSLKDIIIPNYEKDEKRIQDILEERDREEFVRMKIIKKKTI